MRKKNRLERDTKKAEDDNRSAKEKTDQLEQKKTKLEEDKNKNERIVVTITAEIAKTETLLIDIQTQLRLARRNLKATRAKVSDQCLEWFEPNHCGERPICKPHPKGGDVCWHPGKEQQAKQCWKPQDLKAVMQDMAVCTPCLS